jgi:trans-2,3-dihydro-3-hydroxyanthranilate isomerase
MSNLIRPERRMSIKRRYALFDVFTQTALAGNPLAVVLDSDGLNSARKQAIAREFNLSETVFVSPPQNPAHHAAIRIFTPAYELPFAGHPTVGTAVCLAQQDGPLVLEAPVGPIVCDVRGDHASFKLPKLPEAVDLPGDQQCVAAALSLDLADILDQPFHMCAFGAGNRGFACVPVRDLQALAQARQVNALWQAAFGDLIGAFIYTSATGSDNLQFRARMLDLDIGEDPATGSAVAAFAGVLAQQQSLPDGTHVFRIGQGYEMNRPSYIGLTMIMAEHQLKSAHIGGHAVRVAEGLIYA